jgi:hypothetical protein
VWQYDDVVTGLHHAYTGTDRDHDPDSFVTGSHVPGFLAVALFVTGPYLDVRVAQSRGDDTEQDVILARIRWQTAVADDEDLPVPGLDLVPHRYGQREVGTHCDICWSERPIGF